VKLINKIVKFYDTVPKSNNADISNNKTTLKTLSLIILGFLRSV